MKYLSVVSRSTVSAFVVAMVLAASFSGVHIAAQGQIVAGPNRNIAGGPVKWADPTQPFTSQLKEGDPFGQRQDEVSCAADARNPLNVFCAFNDYTPTELGSQNDCETRDAWIGTGWSTDGGATWRNALLAGYPQDTSAEGLASSLRGFSTGADPTVRSGPNGKTYLLGIAFNRPGQIASCTNPGTGSQGGGVVFLQTYVNNNNRENNPRPFQPVGQPVILDSGNTGSVFQDKPWLAIGPDGTIHVTYATFVGGNNPISVIWYMTSKDGVNWKKSKLSEGDKVSNGTVIAVHPTTGWIDIAWRRRQSALSNQTDAIEFVRSKDGGQSFTASQTIVSLPQLTRANDGTLVTRPFDQGSARYAFRNISSPAIAADNFGRTYVAWSERSEHYVNGVLRRDGLIKMVVGVAKGTNVNQVTWTDPFFPEPLLGPNELNRGTQLRPSLWFASGQVMLTYMHTRDDDRVSIYTRQDAVDPGNPAGKIAKYVESFIYKGDLATTPPKPFKMFNDFIFDIGPRPQLETADVDPFAATSPILRRHTEDVMAIMMTPAPSNAVYPNVLPTPNGKTKVSRYAVALVPDDPNNPGSQRHLEQAQVSALGRALHCGGNCAFAGDYDDVVGPAWKPDGTGKLVPNIDPSPVNTFYVSWTDNRDVLPFSATNNFNRVGPGCSDPTATGTRNQNPYFARVGTGLFLFSYGNQKPLNMSFKRAFSVLFQNAVNSTKTYRATIVNPALPGPGSASWEQFTQTTQLKLSITPFSTAARAVYAKSSDASAPITINVQETDLNGNVIPGGLQSTLVLNPDRSTPALLAPLPDPNVDGTNPGTAEVFIPDAASPDAASPDAASNVVRTPDAASPDAASPDAASPDAASVPPQFPDAASPDAASPDAASPDAASPDAASPDAASLPPNGVITDTIYTFTNKSNVAASFGVKTFTTQNLCVGCKLQILVMKPSLTPTQRGCDSKNQDTAALVSNIPSPDLINDPSQLSFSPTDASAKNVTLAVPPGGQLSLVYRLFDPNRLDNFEFTDPVTGRKHSIDPTFDPATDLTPVTIAQSVSTPDIPPNCGVGNNPPCPTQGKTAVAITTNSLFNGVIGRSYPPSVDSQVPYTGPPLMAIGGTGAYTFSLSTGSAPLPAGLTLNGNGGISGTPTGPTGTSTMTFKVQDSSATPNTARRALSIRIVDPLVITNSSLAPATLQQPYSEQMLATGGVGPYSWSSSTLPNGLTLNASTGQISGTATGPVGTTPVTFQVQDNTFPSQINFVTLSLSVIAPNLIVETLTHSPAAPTTTDQITFTATVKNVGDAPAPASKLLFAIGTGSGTFENVPALAPGQSAVITRTANVANTGQYFVFASADCPSQVLIGEFYQCTSAIAESNEQDNQNNDSYTVSWGGLLNTDFTSAGFGGMRGDGTGTITVSGVTGTVKRAMLYWHGPTNSSDPNANRQVTFAGVSIFGDNIGFAQDNNWGFSNSQAYRADVTALVTGDGIYSLSNFLKTSGASIVADINGASLLVFFDDGAPGNNRDVYVHDGNDSNQAFGADPANWSDTLTGIKYSSGTAKVELHVGDGQGLLDASVVLNGVETVAAGPIFQGLSVPNGPNPGNTQPGAGSGGLWDILSWNIPAGVLVSGTNTVTLTSGTDEDALSLVVMIVSVPHVP